MTTTTPTPAPGWLAAERLHTLVEEYGRAESHLADACSHGSEQAFARRLSERDAAKATLLAALDAATAALAAAREEERERIAQFIRYKPGAGFSEDGINAAGWQFASWERGFSDACAAILRHVTGTPDAEARIQHEPGCMWHDGEECTGLCRYPEGHPDD